MASVADHIELANRNHVTLEYLLRDPDPNLEWVVTVGFYKAVHIVEAVFAACAHGHSTSHDNRNSRLRDHFPSIFSPYKHLYNASRVARYLADLSGGEYRTFADFMHKEDVFTLLRKKLYTVEQQSILHFDTDTKRLLNKIDPTRFKMAAPPPESPPLALEDAQAVTATPPVVVQPSVNRS